MNNTRFATAIHILTLLSLAEDGEWQSSDFIAGSINVNPVVVRRELSVLSDAGLVESRKGKEGGSRLLKKATDIQIADIYNAVKNVEVLGKKNQHTNPACPIGKDINVKLNSLFRSTDLAVTNFLGTQTLASFTEQFK